jgi:serine/threonine protein kinase
MERWYFQSKSHLIQTREIKKKHGGQKYTLKRYGKKQLIENKKVTAALQERYILQKLCHPFVTSICYAFQDSQFLYLITDHTESTFAQVCQSFEGFPDSHLRLYAAELVMALEHLHSKSIIYRYSLLIRNLQPETIAIREGHILLNRFECAVMVNKKSASDQVGPRNRMSPEMYHQKPYRFSVDWWQLGLVLYEATYGVVPEFHFNMPESCTLRFLLRNAKSGATILTCVDRETFYSKLLDPIPETRLGFQSDRHGFENDIKSNPWFGSVDWKKIERRMVCPCTGIIVVKPRRNTIQSIAQKIGHFFISKDPVEMEDKDVGDETAVNAPISYIDAVQELLSMYYPTYCFENPSEGLMEKPPID